MKDADRHKMNKNAGFSLLELLIAVVILAVIVFPLLNLFLSSHRLNIRSRQTQQAATLAQDIMEGLKAYDIEELKMQFNEPLEGFYVIDDNLIKGAVAEETAMEDQEADVSGNPEGGIYYFSLRKVSMQGSEFDVLIRVDAREYMEQTDPSKAHMDALNHDPDKPLVLNRATADVRSIDKQNGTFVETAEIRQSILNGILDVPNEVWYFDPTAPKNLRETLEAEGKDADDFKNKLTFKNLKDYFGAANYSRTIEMELSDSADLDEDGRPLIDVIVRQEYSFSYGEFSGSTTGDDSHRVDWIGCGQISRSKPNINIFYYPLYGHFDEIITIMDETDPIWSQPDDPKLSVLIAKQAPPGDPDPSDPSYDPDEEPDPESMTDAQLMAAELDYEAEVEIYNDEGYMSEDDFILKTNLGMNLAGRKYMSGEGMSVDCPSQLIVNGTSMDLSGTSQMNIYTLDGVRSPMGAPGTDDEITELFYNVEVSVYEEGAAAEGFPEEERKVVLDGSKNN